MSISALDDPSPELVAALKSQRRDEHKLERATKRKYPGRSEEFYRGYQAYVNGFRPENGALYYEVIAEMAVGWLCAQRDDNLPQQTEANVRLIAASPDLLLALKEMADDMAEYMTLNKLGDPTTKHVYRMAQAAITKAEGKP
jgi:hypothetical protein